MIRWLFCWGFWGFCSCGLGSKILFPQCFHLLIVSSPFRYNTYCALQLGLLCEWVIALYVCMCVCVHVYMCTSLLKTFSCRMFIIVKLTRSIVFAKGLLSRLHHVSHHSHSWGRDLMGTMWIMLLGKSWSRLEREFGSWESAWYCPLSLSPAASWRNLIKSTT